ncbi:MAG: cyclic nucleotide-binding domain-containing protein [Desulfobacteraceae bacterium]|nr:cyclic nucleotide-binding domain-containing protein [Desulfobacteraceae bacterium]MBC2753982.1 cyclic nucleotide-binding domain-containing protein [Desulfobacteraceae bacterium]
MIGLEFLEQVDVFRNLTDDQLFAIQECAEAVDFKRGDRIFAQGDSSSYVWIVLEGDVELRSEPSGQDGGIRPSPSFMSEAQAFGWTCFVPPYKYRLSGYCASRWCKVIRLESEDLLAIFEQDEVMGFKAMEYLLGAVGKQFEQLQDEIAKVRGIEMMSQW